MQALRWGLPHPDRASDQDIAMRTAEVQIPFYSQADGVRECTPGRHPPGYSVVAVIVRPLEDPATRRVGVRSEYGVLACEVTPVNVEPMCDRDITNKIRCLQGKVQKAINWGSEQLSMPDYVQQ
jgi:hypothetical protein